jgi:hypothetical protein
MDLNTDKAYNESVPECPYCRAILKKFPAKKTKCKICGRDFYLMKKPGTEIYHIVDEKRRSKWKIEEPLYHRLYGLKEYYDLDQEYIEKAILKSSTLRDALWSCYNKALALNAYNSRKKAQLYYSMAEFMYEEGKDPILLIRERNNCLIDEIEDRESLLKKFVTIIASNQQCNNCEHLNGTVMEIDEARRLQLLPVTPCNYHFCTASYHQRFQRDLFGRVIKKDS